MTGTNTHIIEKQILNLVLPNQEKSVAYQNLIKEKYYSELVPVLKEVLDSYCDSEHYLFIDQLHLNLGRIDPDDSFSEVVKRFKAEIRNTLDSVLANQKSPNSAIMDFVNREKAYSSDPSTMLSKNQAAVKAFITYLHEGLFPNWYWVKSYAELESVLLTIREELKREFYRFIASGKSLNTGIYRLTINFSGKLIAHLFSLDTNLYSYFTSRSVQVIEKYLEDERAHITSLTNPYFWHFVKSQFTLFLFKEFRKGSFNIKLLYKQLKNACSNKEAVVFLNRFMGDLYVHLVEHTSGSDSIIDRSVKEALEAILESTTSELSRHDSEKPDRDNLPGNNNPNAEKNTEESKQQNNSHKNSEISAKDTLDKRIEKLEPEPVSEATNFTWKLEENQDKDILKELSHPAKESNTTGSEDIYYASDDIGLLFSADSTPDNQADHLYIQNAGVVLLAPYLELYFKELGITGESLLKDDSSLERAIHNLHYLCFKDIEPTENSLIINKIMLGVPIQHPINCCCKLSSADMEEAESLLQAVIRNWPALKKTKPDGLREGFLQRSGKLIRNDINWKLLIEKKTIDILLSSIPWSYSVVKLPWMKGMIYVE